MLRVKYSIHGRKPSTQSMRILRMKQEITTNSWASLSEREVKPNGLIRHAMTEAGLKAARLICFTRSGALRETFQGPFISEERHLRSSPSRYTIAWKIRIIDNWLNIRHCFTKLTKFIRCTNCRFLCRFASESYSHVQEAKRKPIFHLYSPSFVISNEIYVYSRIRILVPKGPKEHTPLPFLWNKNYVSRLLLNSSTGGSHVNIFLSVLARAGQTHNSWIIPNSTIVEIWLSSLFTIL